MNGKVANILTATMIIFKRMTSPSDLFPKNPRPKTVSDREVSQSSCFPVSLINVITYHQSLIPVVFCFQLSVIVPQATAGLIIGKGGSRVKSIQEESNCHINLTQKNEQLPTNERVVTIQNNDGK